MPQNPKKGIPLHLLPIYLNGSTQRRREMGDAFVSRVLPEYSQRFFGENPTKRFVFKDGAVAIEPVK